MSPSVNPYVINHCAFLVVSAGKLCIEAVGDFLDLMFPRCVSPVSA